MTATPSKGKKIAITVNSSGRHSRAVIRRDTERVLLEFMERKQSAAETVHPRYAELIFQMNQLMRAGGKRLRPYLTTFIYEAYGGGQYSAVLPVAAAQEMLHFAMLIHDDIIDRDEIRYGTTNIGGHYNQLYKDQGSPESEHYALSTALLAGDLAQSWAFELISQSRFSPSQVLSAQNLLNKAIFMVVGGELIETDASIYSDDQADPLVIAEAKTAYYSFVTPLQTGALLAGANEDELATIGKLGKALGVAYQLTDDLISMYGDESVTGKSNLSDIREGKRHYLYRYTKSHLQGDESIFFESEYGRQSISQESAKKIRELVESSGAKAQSERLIESFTETSSGLIEALSIGPGFKLQLEKQIKTLTKRAA